MYTKNILLGLFLLGTGILGSKFFYYVLSENRNSRNLLDMAEARSNRANDSNCFMTYLPEKSIFKKQCSSIMKFGLPGNENIRIQDRYIISYSYRLRQSIWVMEKLSRNTKIGDEVDRDQCHFSRDPTIPSMFSATNDDYKDSGYDRGHLAAAANHKMDQESHCSTFFLSNVSPQIGRGFNQNIWEQLEAHTRKLTRNYEDVYICTGILFLPQYDEAQNEKYVYYKVIGNNNVAVPTHYFKVILGVKPNDIYEVQSFVLPNEFIKDSISLEFFSVSINFIEKNSGLIFFNKINREDLVQVKPKIKAIRRNITEDEF